MRTRTKRVVASIFALTLVLAACGEAPDEDGSTAAPEEGHIGDEPADEGTAEEVDLRACMITDQDGVDDGSFNETSYQGLVQARDELGVDIDVLESQSETDFQPNMQAFVQQGCDLIVSVGFLLAEVTD